MKSLQKIIFVLGIILILFTIIYGVSFRQKKSIGKQSETKETVVPTAAPTLAPTPTPTLTLEQISAIRKKKFTDINNRYGPCKYVPILMYHHVLDPQKAKAISATNLNVPPDIFRTQMDYLLGKGYQIIDLNELMNGLRNTLPGKGVVLTFDDGYRDFYENIYPVLKEKNIKATVFVISQFVGGERYLDWWQIQEMANSGLVLIGDHTLNHLSLPRETKEGELNQIVSAKNVIEQRIGKSVQFFAYPYGSANQNAKEILQENGFLGAVVTTNISPQCAGLPYELSRIRIGAASLSRYGL